MLRLLEDSLSTIVLTAVKLAFKRTGHRLRFGVSVLHGFGSNLFQVDLRVVVLQDNAWAVLNASNQQPQ